MDSFGKSREKKELDLHYPGEREAVKNNSKGMVREYLEAIVIAVVLALVIKAFVIQAFKIPSGSMKSTLLIGDHILVTKFAYDIKVPYLDKELVKFHDPSRQDIVVFQYPLDPDKDFIKRVIGLPGDTVLIQNKKVYINGKLLDEPYVQHTDPNILPAGASPRDNFGPIVVPPHSFFVMGDNRDESYDSRFWKFVDFSALKGKALIIYWSWNSDGSFTIDSSKSYVRWDRMGKLLH